ncbi:MAG: hypothetical protein ACP5QK_04845 [Myxococcota bacterium]
MSNHIDRILIEFNFREDALKNDEISQHINICSRCNEIFERYFHTLEQLRNGTCTITLSKKDEDEIFTNITSSKPSNKKSLFKKIAIAAAIIIILLASLLYYSKSSNQNKIIINQICYEAKEDMEIISDLDLFSNLEIIEHIDELEEIKEVLDDEI